MSELRSNLENDEVFLYYVLNNMNVVDLDMLTDYLQWKKPHAEDSDIDIILSRIKLCSDLNTFAEQRGITAEDEEDPLAKYGPDVDKKVRQIFGTSGINGVINLRRSILRHGGDESAVFAILDMINNGLYLGNVDENLEDVPDEEDFEF